MKEYAHFSQDHYTTGAVCNVAFTLQAPTASQGLNWPRKHFAIKVLRSSTLLGLTKLLSVCAHTQEKCVSEDPSFFPDTYMHFNAVQIDYWNRKGYGSRCRPPPVKSVALKDVVPSKTWTASVFKGPPLCQEPNIPNGCQRAEFSGRWESSRVSPCKAN